MLTIDSLCWLCLQPLRIASHGVCSVCLTLIPKLPPCCPRCGLPAQSEASPCHECQARPPAWSQLVAVCDYVDPIKRLIARLKFHREDKYAPTLARLMLLAWLNARRRLGLARPDLLLPVPLHRIRHWRRGFNQSERIVRLLSRWVGCRTHSTALVRLRATRPQQSLEAQRRKDNLLGAFACRADVRGLHVAVFDDVVTTGSTVEEIGQLLLHHGAASVQVWCLCRTLKSESK